MFLLKIILYPFGYNFLIFIHQADFKKMYSYGIPRSSWYSGCDCSLTNFLRKDMRLHHEENQIKTKLCNCYNSVAIVIYGQ